MENLMNKVANDLKSFAPQAPTGMEDRIQNAMAKKKSFWAFSWYTMNVYAVALIGAGVLALVFWNRGDSNTLALSLAPAAKEVKIIPVVAANVNSNSDATLNADAEMKSTAAPATTRKRTIQKETNTSVLVVENCQSISIVDPPIAEVTETVEVQRVPEEIQVPKVKQEVVKPKGRSLRLTRLTGK